MRIPSLKMASEEINAKGGVLEIGKAVGALALSATLGLSSVNAEEEVKIAKSPTCSAPTTSSPAPPTRC